MTLDEPPGSPPARTLGWVWLVAGGVAVVVGLITTVAMIVVFGVVAALLGLALLGVAHLRDKSRRRAARTLSGDPPPPSTAPYRPPPRPAPRPEPEPGSGTAVDDEDDDGDEDQDQDDDGDEDGYGEPISEQDRPGRRPGVADRTDDTTGT